MLPVLALIDPIRAMRDAGILLSDAAANHLKKSYPHHDYDNPAMYHRVRQGKAKLPPMFKVTRVRRP